MNEMSGEGNVRKDLRRYGVIEVRMINDRTYHLTIRGQMWSEVEWSPERRAWCVQDACGFCLAHCEHIHGEHVDARTALALAKAMIRDGRMPTPEDAARQLTARRQTSGVAMPLTLSSADDLVPAGQLLHPRRLDGGS
jgi:hypothetical protein